MQTSSTASVTRLSKTMAAAVVCSIFFFNDTATTEIYTLSLHDALPISPPPGRDVCEYDRAGGGPGARERGAARRDLDRKSTRLNSSHGYISYAVFCLKKKRNDRLLWHVFRR